MCVRALVDVGMCRVRVGGLRSVWRSLRMFVALASLAVATFPLALRSVAPPQILSSANSNVIPQLFLGHTVHLVCASNGVLPDKHQETLHAHAEPLESPFQSLPQHLLLVADTLDTALQVGSVSQQSRIPCCVPGANVCAHRDVISARLPSRVWCVAFGAV